MVPEPASEDEERMNSLERNAQLLADRLNAIAHLATEGTAEAIGADGLRPETALEAIAVLAASSLPGAIALDGGASAPDLPANLEAHLENARKKLLQEALDRCDGVQTKAAKLLRMSFRSFRTTARNTAWSGSRTRRSSSRPQRT